jgi:uncharacterized protein (TIGR02145 family)
MAATAGWPADPTPGNIGNNQAANNASGFTALPGGFRKSNGGTLWNSIGLNGYWRSTTEGLTPVTTSWYRALNYNDRILGRNDFGSWNGYSVRCLKN